MAKPKKKISVLELATTGLTNKDITVLLEESIANIGKEGSPRLGTGQSIKLAARPQTFESQPVKE